MRGSNDTSTVEPLEQKMAQKYRAWRAKLPKEITYPGFLSWIDGRYFQSHEYSLSILDTLESIHPGTLRTGHAGKSTCRNGTPDCPTVTGRDCECQAKFKLQKNSIDGRGHHRVRRRFSTKSSGYGRIDRVYYCIDVGKPYRFGNS
jgi:hypothetical protein